MILCVFILFSVSSALAQLDLNPAHQLCQPCIMSANAVKSMNKAPGVKETEKRTCNTVLNNDLVCNGAVEVVGIYLNWTPAQTICENFRLCSAANENKKLRAPARAVKRPDELAVRVLKAFDTDEFPALPPRTRLSRQAGFNLSDIENFEKLLREHSVEINQVVLQFADQFKHALQTYLDAQSRE